MHANLWLESFKEDDTKLDLRQYVLGTWIGFIWLRMGVGGGFL
jgi:hypothetical protein